MEVGRRRPGRPARAAEPALRALLHHQGGRPRHRPGPRHRPPDRREPPRPGARASPIPRATPASRCASRSGERRDRHRGRRARASTTTCRRSPPPCSAARPLPRGRRLGRPGGRLGRLRRSWWSGRCGTTRGGATSCWPGPSASPRSRASPTRRTCCAGTATSATSADLDRGGRARGADAPSRRPGEPVDWPDADEVVVKPAVSAGALDTERYTRPARDGRGARRAPPRGRPHRDGPALPARRRGRARARPLLVMLGGAFSHALRKGPMLVPGLAGGGRALRGGGHPAGRRPTGGRAAPAAEAAAGGRAGRRRTCSTPGSTWWAASDGARC